jgi:toxin ParE1/3/4
VIAYRFHDAAVAEFDEAAVWFDQRLLGLAAVFRSEVETSLRSIQQNPYSGRLLDKGRRRRLVGKFPYAIIYRIDPEVITVLAVAHQRRRPDYWRTRR